MMRALYSGVAGLKGHQTRMDVIGNNIANVNTTGFKAGRLTFQDMMSQTLQGASGANGAQGGTNPIQVGLGVGVSSIDNIFTDGNVQSTGVPTDLCISGDGFFALTDGSQQYYTRAGDFKFDDAGNYVSPSGLKVLGWMTDANGKLSNSGTPTALYKPTTPMPAKATSQMTFTGTLNSNTANGGVAGTTADIYDSLGNVHTLSSNYYKVTQDTAAGQSGTNTWYCVNNVTGISANSLQNEYSKLQFNTDGTLKSITTITPTAGGSANTTTTIDGLKLSTNTATSTTTTAQALSFAQVDDLGAMHVFQMKFDYNSSSGNWNCSVYEPSNAASPTTPLSTFTVASDPATTYTGFPQTITYKDAAGAAQTVTLKIAAPVAADATAMSGYADEAGMTNATVQTIESPLKFSAAGVDPVSVAFNRTAVTQSAATSSSVSPALNDGYKMGTLTNVSFNTQGQMIGTFSNNQIRTLGQVAMANFANPGGLTKIGDTMYSESNNSGIAQIGASGTGGRGVITPASLEMSNVDLAEQFSDMIVTQRGFQANSKIITTTDDMLEELANLKR